MKRRFLSGTIVVAACAGAVLGTAAIAAPSSQDAGQTIWQRLGLTPTIENGQVTSVVAHGAPMTSLLNDLEGAGSLHSFTVDERGSLMNLSIWATSSIPLEPGTVFTADSVTLDEAGNIVRIDAVSSGPCELVVTVSDDGSISFRCQGGCEDATETCSISITPVEVDPVDPDDPDPGPRPGHKIDCDCQ